MKMKKTIALMTALALMAGTVGCSNSGGASDAASAGSAASGQAAAAGKKVELELFMSKPETVDIIEKISAKFMQENPNVKINVTSSSDGRTVLQTRLSANEVPDILNTFPAEDFYKEMFKEGFIQDISGQSYLNRVQDTYLKMSEYEGKYYAVPMSVSTYGIYVNKDVMQKGGIAATPSTWTELIDDCAALKSKGITAFLFPNKDVGNIAQRFERTVGIINNNSSSEFKDIADGKTKAQDSKTLKAWMDYNTELLKYANKDHMGMDYDAAVASFSKGDAAMMMSGTWMLATIKKDNPNANVELTPFPNPTGEETKVPVNLDTSFSISATCKNKEMGEKFLEYVTRPEIAQMYCDVDGNVSLIQGVDYKVPEHQSMKKAVGDNKVFLTAVNFWPNGLREDIRPYCQEFLGSGDRSAFLESAGKSIKNIYESNSN